MNLLKNLKIRYELSRITPGHFATDCYEYTKECYDSQEPLRVSYDMFTFYHK